MRKTTFYLVMAATLVGLGGVRVGGSQDLVDDGEDSIQVLQHLEAARRIGGAEWRTTADFLCGPNPDPGNAAASPLLAPTRIFDNLYAIGRSSTVVYAITTEDGIILIDAGYADQVESVLLPGLRRLGLDPGDIRYVIVAHGHRDHYGGSRYLQEQYGTSIVLSGADWELLERDGADLTDGAVQRPPDRDLVAEEGRSIVLGDVAVTPVLIPGHTPGALGLVFPVRDGDEMHMAGLFGGTILITSRISDDGLQQYLSSIEHYAAVVREKGVDVEIQNHPIIDDMAAKLMRLESRTVGVAHPFVVGTDACQDFLRVISACTEAEVARRAGG